MNHLTFAETYDKYIEEKRANCRHVFVDGYNAVTLEAYQRCPICGMEKNRRQMSQDDAERFLGVMDRLSAKDEKKHVGEQLSLNLEGNKLSCPNCKEIFDVISEKKYDESFTKERSCTECGWTVSSWCFDYVKEQSDNIDENEFMSC